MVKATAMNLFLILLAALVAISAHAAPVRCEFEKDVVRSGDTNRLSDVTTIKAKQRAGMKLTIEFKDRVNASWTWLVAFEACPTARLVETVWTQPDDQRPAQRFFRARETRPVLFGAGAPGTFRFNPRFYGLKATSVPQR